MKTVRLWVVGVSVFLLSPLYAQATGMVPETSVVIVEESDGEGGINLKNTDDAPVLLLTSLAYTADDKQPLLTVTPPAARVEPGKTQRVRFMLTSPEPLKTERLQRVTFEGVPPQVKGKNEVRMTVRQNLPVLIRPAGLEKDPEPWKRLVWKLDGNKLIVSNPSAYVVRLGQNVKALPGGADWMLPNSYVLPGQALTLEPQNKKPVGGTTQVQISPATTWGYTVNTYDAPLSQ